MEKPAKIPYADVRARLETIIDEKGVTDYTLRLESAVAKGDNHVGLVLKATIKGVDSAGTKIALDWIVKCAPKNFRAMMKIDKVYERETYVYEKLLPLFEDFQAKRLIADPFDEHPVFVASHKERPHEIIVMDDMKTRGFVMKDKKAPLDLRHVRLAVRAYAKFHAVSYALKCQRPRDFEEVAVNTHEYVLSDPNVAAFEPHQIALNKKALGALDPIEDAYYVEKFQRYVDTPFEVVTRELLKAQVGRYAVVTHGDSWVNNMLFLYD